MVKLNLKDDQFKIILLALEVYIATLSEEYDNNPTIKYHKRMDKAQQVLAQLKLGRWK
jgi:hypothetical protein